MIDFANVFLIPDYILLLYFVLLLTIGIDYIIVIPLRPPWMNNNILVDTMVDSSI